MKKRIVSVALCLMMLCMLMPGAWAGNYLDDEIEYVVVPYVIQTGDSLSDVYLRWGLKIEKYVDLICAINGVDDLDVLVVDTVYYLPTTVDHATDEGCVTVVSHRMQRGETAYQVFTDYGIDYNANIARLQSFNGGADLARIDLGEKLYIPVL